jgi:hypothetical protein
MKRFAVILTLAALAACATRKASILDEDFDRWQRTTAEGVTVRWRDGEVASSAVETVAREIARVRTAVGEALALVGSASAPPPYAEVILYRDAGWGQERWLVTHAMILERPLRVRIPCALPEDDQDGDKIAARIRGTIAHEIAEATVLTRVPILDPYLRWLHDGVAESVEYRVLQRLDPQAAADVLQKYELYSREARRNAITWVDLTRWRQLPDWIVHSDVLFPKGGPLRLDDLAGSLRRVSEKRFANQERDPETLAALDVLVDLVAETWSREQLAVANGEADPRPRPGQFLCYDASFCFWLELERGRPGITAAALARIAARHEPVLRSEDVMRIVSGLAGEDVRPRLERFTLDRLDGVLAAERPR